MKSPSMCTKCNQQPKSPLVGKNQEPDLCWRCEAIARLAKHGWPVKS